MLAIGVTAMLALMLMGPPKADVEAHLGPGWREVTLRDFKPAADAKEGNRYDYETFRLTKAHHYLRAEGDFDGNGYSDYATFLINQKKGRYGLFAFMTELSGGVSVHRLASYESDLIANWGIDTVKPGTYLTTCGQGYGPNYCADGQPKSVTLKHPGVESISFGSASSYYYWNGEGFDRVYISD